MQNRWGVYMIQSKSKPERVYVGSSINIKTRLSDHKGDLKYGRHDNPKLQSHYDKYGGDDLEYSIIECGDYVSLEHLLAREQIWFGRYGFKTNDIPYFNILPITGSCKGVKRSEEAIRKNREVHTGLRRTSDVREKESRDRMGEGNPFFGKTHKEETKQKQREAALRLGQKPPVYRLGRKKGSKNKSKEDAK